MSTEAGPAVFAKHYERLYGVQALTYLYNLRTLCLSSEPESLAFRSDQGELLLGIHSHVYHIDLSKLLPNPYQLKIMCLEPSVVDTQPHIAVTEDVLLSLSSHDKRRLTEPHSAYSRRTVGSIRINEETKTRHLQTGEQSQEFARLSARDQELQLLQDGMLKPNKKRQSNKNTKREAMNKYMQLFYKEKLCVKIPDVDSFNSDAEQMMTNVLQVEDSALGRSLCRGGFFPDVAPIASAEALSRDIQAFLSCRSIPNSAVVQLFWPSKMLEKQHEVEHSLWRDILEHIPHIPQGTDQAQKIMLKEEIKYIEDVRDDVEEEQDEELRNAMAILQKITETEKISPPTEDTSRVLSPPLPEVKPKNTDLPRPKKTVHSRIPLLKPLPPKSPKKTVVIKEPVFDKPPVSPVPTQLDKPPTPCTYSPEVHTPVHEEREVISPPLPFFVQQFQAKDWFTTICPETEVHMMSEAGFESRLLQGVLYRDLPMRIEVLQALKILHQYGQLKDSMKTFQTLITVINQRSLNLKVSEDREFVFSCLRFMNDMFRGHKDLVLELLVTCVLVHPSLRAPLVNFLWDLGLQDPHGFMLKEINTWDSWEVTENHRESLRKSVEEWLQNWTLKLQNFVAESLRSITLGAYDEGTRVKRHHMKGAGRLRDKPKKTQDQRSSDIDVNTMEVLNYFCEVQLEKEMQVAPPRQGGTVLALPPINSKRALMRLGETSAPFRRKYEDDAQLPPILQPLFPEIIHFIDLPLKKISLYPFSPMQDASDSQDNIMSLNQEVHKYFIQQRSFTHSYY
ncbi:WD repeat-containing protein 97 [Bombina bombina]|uniref:WD repeat-containing protein 97 n=1 Tax=Bombina bombina TaxID=8345 RepID=UPI00235AA207|nr:WD repeat-containing protein 97 [Bombina bombina]